MPTAPAPRRTDPRPAARVGDVRLRASRLVQGVDVLRRLLAAAVLLGVLVGVPIAISRLADGVVPRWASIRSAWTTGRIDDEALVQIGALLFTSLWLWFGATAVAEAAHVLRARSRAAGRPVVLEPVSRTPSGSVRRLVRLALISSTALIGTSFAPLVVRGGGEARAAGAEGWRQSARIEVTVDDPTTAHRVDRARTGEAPPASVPRSDERIELARPRDTPYSIAARLGDAGLRDRIIQLNHGSIAADGSRWTGGVFPAGTVVRVPETRPGPGDATAASATSDIRWVPHRVEPGESIFAIAAEIARDDDRSVGDVADQIIRRNLGRAMGGGAVFDDPSLILVGWTLEVPTIDRAAAAPIALGSDTLPNGAAVDPDVGRVVEVGDSYWRIAEERLEAQLGAPADPPLVAAATADLRAHNAPLLGHDDPDLLLPGEVVRWVDAPAHDAQMPLTASGPAATEPPLADPPTSAATDPSSVAPTTTTATTPSPTAPAATAPVPADAATAPASIAPAGSAPVVPGSIAPMPSAVVSRPPAAPATVSSPGSDRGGAVPDSEEDAEGVPQPVTIGATVLLAAGAIGLLEARRREQLRRATVRSRIVDPTPRAARTEIALRRLDATERAMRIDVALRAAATRLVAHHRHVVGLLLDDAGEVTLLLDAGAAAAAPWEPANADGSRWRLPAAVRTVELAGDARQSSQPCPALVHLGRTPAAVDLGGGGAGAVDGLGAADLFVDAEALGLLCIDGPAGDAAAMVLAIGATLAASPLSEVCRTITVGQDRRAAFDNPNVESADDIDAAVDLAATHLGSTGAVSGGRRTFSLRATAGDGRTEMWEPVVIVASGEDVTEEVARDVVALAGCGGRGLGVVLDRAVPGATWVARWNRGDERDRHADPGAGATCRLEPVGIAFTPVRLERPDLDAVDELLTAAAAALPHAEEPELLAPPPSCERSPFEEQPWQLMVRVLGGVSVVDREGNAVELTRSKSLELLAWLATHRDRPTRSAARTALWELDVRAATFANVVSEARRGTARLVAPPDGEEWIERTLTEHLPLHRLVVTDADLLRARVEAARGRPPAEAVEILRPGLELVTDLPFAGTGYLWPDGEGITSGLTLLATAAATELARHHLQLGDVDGVFWATGQGLRVLPGHEELIALRMRAYAQRGDLAGVRGEWEVYERALHADPWSSAEPSAKLVAVRRELLTH